MMLRGGYPRPFDHIASSRKCLSTIFLEGKFAVGFPRLLWVHFVLLVISNARIQSVLLIFWIGTVAKRNSWFTPQTISRDCRRLQMQINCYTPDCSETTRGHAIMSPTKPITKCICLALWSSCDIPAALSVQHGLAFLLSILKCNMSKCQTHFSLRQEHPDLPMPQCSE